jgi:hypothetical protein
MESFVNSFLKSRFYLLSFIGWISVVMSSAASFKLSFVKIRFVDPNPPPSWSSFGWSPQHLGQHEPKIKPQHRVNTKQGNLNENKADRQSIHISIGDLRDLLITSMSRKNIALSTKLPVPQLQQQPGRWWREITRLLVNAMVVFGPQHLKHPCWHSYTFVICSPLSGENVFSKWVKPPGCIVTGCVLINTHEMSHKTFIS